MVVEAVGRSGCRKATAAAMVKGEVLGGGGTRWQYGLEDRKSNGPLSLPCPRRLWSAKARRRVETVWLAGRREGQGYEEGGYRLWADLARVKDWSGGVTE